MTQFTDLFLSVAGQLEGHHAGISNSRQAKNHNWT